MNHDDPTPDLHPLIDPEIEARLDAWVAGEASPFEIAELTRLIGEKPELEIFKRRIEAVHGLAIAAVRPDQPPLRLSAERRAKLLQAIGAPENKSASAALANVVAPTFTPTKQAHRKERQWLLALAACVTVGLFTTLTFQTLRHSYGNGVPLDLPASNYKAQEKPVLFELVSGPPAESQNSLSLKGDAFRQDSEPKKGGAHKERVQRLAQSSKNEVDELLARRMNLTGLQPETTAPEIASFGVVGPANLDHAFATPMGYSGDKKSVHNYYTHDENPAEENPANRSQEKTWGAAHDLSASHVGLKNQAAASGYIDKEKLQLSPFMVASNGSGYAANNTLAGSRLNPELKDAGSAISVVTSQFLKNVAVRMAAVSDDEQYEGSPAYTGAAIDHPLISPQTSSLRASADALTLPVFSLQSGKSTTAEFETIGKPTTPAQASDAASKKSDETRVDEDRPLAPAFSQPAPIAAPVEVNAAKEPVSTFSLHVSDVSFRLAQAALANNEAIDPARIRPEEFYNAFSYGDPTPALAEKVSCRVEQAAHPFLQQRNLIRISTKVAAAGRDAAQPLHLTVLLDNSGSMEREDRAAIVHRAMETLVSLLGPNDRITLIGFARQPSLLAESLPGDQSAQLLDLIARTPSSGGTNLEEALKLGGELARRQFEPAARNRIVVLTDGAANLGNANPAQLATAIETLRQQGIAFDACGVGLEGLDDAMLENLTRKGDGRYYVLNSPEAADAEFAHQLAGAFRPAAENVKLQVRFNPARVGNYRLIGFEQHRLREEDFRNDRIDAAELAAEEAAVAVYQVETLPQGEGELGEVYVRFRDASSGNMVERSWTLSYDPQTPAFDRATPSMQLAGTATLLAEKLRDGQNGDAIKLSELAPVVARLRSHYANEPRVQELVTMFEQMRRRTGE